MSEEDQESKMDAWEESLGEGAREALEDLAGTPGEADAERALDALAEAFGEDASAELPDPGLPDDYAVLGILGRGASGVVYRARQLSLDREVAVKVMHPGGDVRATERLVGEARRLAALVHPGIVAVHEVGRARTGVYITLELQLGGSLQGLLAAEPLNPARAARLTRQAAEAVAYTHSRGVVHLDLKPGNVLLDADGDARVADFGLAREVAGMEMSATSGGLLGTPAFMAPEQAADRRDLIGERTDVYGLGALLYACLAGAAPFTQRSLAEMLHAVRFDQPKSLEQGAGAIPRDLLAIVGKAMAKDPKDRYPTAQALAQDLARFETGGAVEARLPSLLQRGVLRVRRSGREVAIAVAAALISVVSVLPFQGDGGSEAEGWMQATDELLTAGEDGAARLLLDRIEDGVEVDAQQAERVAYLRRRASRDKNSTSGEAQNEETLGLAAGDWEWLQGRRDSEWLRKPSLLWRDSPLDLEYVWQRLIGSLADEWGILGESDRERAVAIVNRAPQWGWDDGFANWLEEAPTDSRDLLEHGVGLASVGRFGVLVDFIAVDDHGHAVKVGSHSGEAKLGEILRFEGKGESGIRVPWSHSGIDFLRIAPSEVGIPHGGDVSFEIEGRFQATAGGVLWRVFDHETTFWTKPRAVSWFLDTVGREALVGGPTLLGAHQCRWGANEGMTILALAEVVEVEAGDEFHPDRSLSDWADRFASALEGQLALPFDSPAWWGVPPAGRAAFLDNVEALAMLGPVPARASLEAIRTRLADADLEPGTLSDGFWERGTFTGTTTAGGDFGYWLDTALQVAAGEHAGPGKIMAALPRPAYVGERKPGFNWKSWLFTLYVVVALWMLIKTLRLPGGSPHRISTAGWSIIVAAQGLDKTAPSLLGGLPWDPVSLALMAWACFVLVPWARTWARVAAWAFLAASLQEVLLLFEQAPDVRLPLSVAFVGLAGMAAKLDPQNRLGWIRIPSIVLYLIAGLVAVFEVQAPTFVGGLYYLTVAWTLIVMLCVAVTASRRSCESRASSD